MAFIKKLSELSAAKDALAQQEKQLNDERTQALSSLHIQFGYPDLKSFIKALKSAPRPKKGKAAAKVKSKVGKGAKRRELRRDLPAFENEHAVRGIPARRGRRGHAAHRERNVENKRGHIAAIPQRNAL